MPPRKRLKAISEDDAENVETPAEDTVRPVAANNKRALEQTAAGNSAALPDKATELAEALQLIHHSVGARCAAVWSAAREAATSIRSCTSMEIIKIPKQVRERSVADILGLTGMARDADSIHDPMQLLMALLQQMPQQQQSADPEPSTALKSRQPQAASSSHDGVQAEPGTARASNRTAAAGQNTASCSTADVTATVVAPRTLRRIREEAPQEFATASKPRHDGGSPTTSAPWQQQNAFMQVGATPATVLPAGFSLHPSAAPCGLGMTLLKRVGGKGRTTKNCIALGIVMSDGTVVSYDKETGLANVPRKYHAQVSQQLAMLKQLHDAI